jgi:hypothetical protein
MRKSVLIATVLVIMSQGYRAARGDSPSAKTVISWGFTLLVLSGLSISPLAKISDIFSYIIIAAILLNDGYDIASNI